MMYYIHEAVISSDFNLLYDVVDYYSENYDEDIIFHLIDIIINKITDDYTSNSDIINYNELFNYLVSKIDINRVAPEAQLTPAHLMLIVIFKNIRGKWSDYEPEDFYQFIELFFSKYVDMNAGNPSINQFLTIDPDEHGNDKWCKNEIKKMINKVKSEKMNIKQKLSFVSNLNPNLGIDSPLNYLDQDTMSKLYNYIPTPSIDIDERHNEEYNLDPLLKSKQRLSLAKGFSDQNSYINIREDHLKTDIGNHVSSHRPYPSVQNRYIQQSQPQPKKKSRRFAKRTIKNRRRQNRY